MRAAQKLDGPFMTDLLGASEGTDMVIVFCMHVPIDGEEKVHNVQVAVSNGKIVAAYTKLHLYDAFVTKESERVVPGNEIPPLFEVAGMKVGMLTCYDVRFPELARHHAIAGADVLVLPAAWIKGPGKEHHWKSTITVRALENTCYVVAVGECGPRNIGSSMVVDPLGIATVMAGSEPSLIFSDISAERIEKSRAALPVLKNRRFAQQKLA
ncbi:nitrilase-related carbon-nitrogen hydrolase [Ahrensia kielensis]|uniref:Nitrilase-related carbon-nitrogen hydrolase n=1 Tax=Ahrensia kielensis TaxID=76980 RepID=A0ABU9T2N4_9HYPH